MRIIILGGTGFVGYHLSKLLSINAEVIVISRSPPTSQDRITGVVYQQGDCASPEFLKRVIRSDDYVVYLVYNTVTKTSFDDPLRDIQENLPLAINLLTILREVSVKKLLYVLSGGTVYGSVKAEMPILEGHSTNPISPYSITKLAIEKYCQMYARLFGIPVVIARPGNPFGPYQVPYRGQGFVATVVAKVLRGEELTIFGEFGTVREYLFIDYLVSAMEHLIQADVPAGSVYNIGSGVGMNNLEVLCSVAKAVGMGLPDIKIEFLPTRSFDNALNVAKLNEQGWRPPVDFNAGLSQTVAGFHLT